MRIRTENATATVRSAEYNCAMYLAFAVRGQSVFLALLFMLAVLVRPSAVQAQDPQVPKEAALAQSCNEFLPPKKQLGDKNIGPEQCRVVSEEIVFNAKGQPYRHLELRISGALVLLR
jgi:hypothetical protein